MAWVQNLDVQIFPRWCIFKIFMLPIYNFVVPKALDLVFSEAQLIKLAKRDANITALAVTISKAIVNLVRIGILLSLAYRPPGGPRGKVHGSQSEFIEIYLGLKTERLHSNFRYANQNEDKWFVTSAQMIWAVRLLLLLQESEKNQ